MASPEEKYMKIAIKEALKGSGYVSPNPLVGAVLVKNGKIIGKGYHKKFGENHAEVNAIESSVEDVKGSELYVTLEPCDHFGKTPPCSERIINCGISKVFIGSSDPSENAGGRSVLKFLQNGIDVHTGILSSDCDKINLSFFKYLSTGLPYVVLKLASSLDGSLSTANGDSKWISCEKSRIEVHKLRNFYDAVMVGKNTVISDNPKLTVRLVNGRNPVRIVVDSRLELSLLSHVFNDDAKTLVITDINCDPINETKFRNRSISLIKVRKNNGILDIAEAFKKIGEIGIRSILAEGGTVLSDYLLKNELVDRINLFLAPLLIGSNKKFFQSSSFDKIINCPKIDLLSAKKCGRDIFVDGFPRYKR